MEDNTAKQTPYHTSIGVTDLDNYDQCYCSGAGSGDTDFAARVITLQGI
jgi:hypothetical protein